MYYLLPQSDDTTMPVSLRFQCLIWLTCKFDKIKLLTYTHKVCMLKIAKEALSTQVFLRLLCCLPFPWDNRWQQISIWAVFFLHAVFIGGTA